MKNTYSIEIDAPPEKVFYWLDGAERVKKWLPNVVENEDLNVTEDRVGSTFRQTYEENGQCLQMDGVVTVYEMNKRLDFELTGKTFDLDVKYRLDDLHGRTRLTQDSHVKFKGFMKVIGALMGPFIKRGSRKQLADTFETLKNLAESGTTNR